MCLNFILVLLLINFSKLSSNFIIECTHETQECSLRNFKDEFNAELINFPRDARHYNTLTLTVQDSEMTKIPDGISLVFPLIETLIIDGTNLKEISNPNLKKFQRLKSFSAPNNDIKTLPDNLFDENLQIESINLTNNKINEISPQIFCPLANLHTFDVSLNHCIDKTYSGIGDSSEKSIMTKELCEMCPKKPSWLLDGDPHCADICVYSVESESEEEECGDCTYTPVYFRAKSKIQVAETTPFSQTKKPAFIEKSSTQEVNKLTKASNFQTLEPENESSVHVEATLAPTKVPSTAKLVSSESPLAPNLDKKLSFYRFQSISKSHKNANSPSECVCSCIPKAYNPKLNSSPIQPTAKPKEFNLCFNSINYVSGEPVPKIKIQTPKGPSTMPPFVFKFDPPKPQIDFQYFPPNGVNSILVAPAIEGCNHEATGELVCTNPNEQTHYNFPGAPGPCIKGPNNVLYCKKER